MHNHRKQQELQGTMLDSPVKFIYTCIKIWQELWLYPYFREENIPMQELQGTKLYSSVIYLLQGPWKAFYHLSYCKQQQLGDNMIMSSYD